jgi:hypothetical protein
MVKSRVERTDAVDRAGISSLPGLKSFRPARRWEGCVIVCLAAGMGGLIVLRSGACLWWRLVRPELWERRADPRGGLRQATGWTCYPAAAVMLLHHYGIAAGEGEMAYSANTSLWGTDDHPMARALTARGYPSGWRGRVEIRRRLIGYSRPEGDGKASAGEYLLAGLGAAALLRRPCFVRSG